MQHARALGFVLAGVCTASPPLSACTMVVAPTRASKNFKIIAERNQEPLRNAVLRIYPRQSTLSHASPAREVVTDKSGSGSIRNLAEGEYDVMLAENGYEVEAAYIDVSTAFRESTLPIELPSKAPSPSKIVEKSLRAVILDPIGAVIPGAKFTVRFEDGSLVSDGEGTTSDKGELALPLRDGNYVLTVEGRRGFLTAVVPVEIRSTYGKAWERFAMTLQIGGADCRFRYPDEARYSVLELRN